MNRSLLLALLAFGCLGEPRNFTLEPPDSSRYLGPTVVGVDPPPGSHGIPLDYPLSVTLSAPVRADTLLSSVTLRGRSFFPFALSISTDARTLTVIGEWPPEESLRLLISAALLDEMGRPLRDQDPHDGESDTPFALALTTGSDRMRDPPRILAFEPSEMSDNVSPYLRPTVRFSKRMASSGTRIYLTGPEGVHESTLQWERGRTVAALALSKPLRFGSVYDLVVASAADDWGLEALTTRSSFATQRAAGQVVINEVVTDPQHDWNQSEGGNGDPFGPIPGTGAITTSDEYVEIFNGGVSSISLVGWLLEQRDGSDQTHAFGTGSSVTERFYPRTSTLDRFEPGAYLVVGNPVGDNRNEVTLVLRDANGFERDSVRLGGGGAPEGAATGVTAEAVSRVPNGSDTDVDAVDWRLTRATPGERNP